MPAPASGIFIGGLRGLAKGQIDLLITRSDEQERQLEVVCPSFALLPHLVVGTQRLATVHRRLAKLFASFMPLQIYEAPLSIPPIRAFGQWHAARADEPALRWLIDQVRLEEAD